MLRPGSRRSRGTLGIGNNAYATRAHHQAIKRSTVGLRVSGYAVRSCWRRLCRWVGTGFLRPAIPPRPRMDHGCHLRRRSCLLCLLCAHRTSKPEQDADHM